VIREGWLTAGNWVIAVSAATAAGALGAIGLCTAARAELPVEQITVAPLPAAHPYRLYFTDVAIDHLADDRVAIIDGRSMKLEGMLSTGMFGQTTLSPDRSEFYVATTYYARLNRGEKTEYILVYGTQDLRLKEEIPYNARHAPALPYRGTLRTSGDGRFLFVQNATPASSVSVVNRATKQMVAEIPTPGCYVVYPALQVHRFATLCGDGTALTVSLDDDGMPIAQKKSERFFDPDADALFVSAAQQGDTYYLVSFLGQIYSMNVQSEIAKVDAPWSLVSDSERRQGWRPGGYQPIALHLDSATLYVGMHPGGKEGSHKDAAREIWVFNLRGHRRVARVATPAATGLETSQGKEARLFAFNSAGGSITAFDGLRKLRKVATGRAFGSSPTQLEVH